MPILGPLRGQLANGGDTVALYKPDPPQGLQHDDAGFVPYILVDQVTFSDTAPYDCPKTDALVTEAADHIASKKAPA